MPKKNADSSVCKPATVITKEVIKAKDQVYLDRVMPLISDLMTAKSRTERICAIRDLQEYLGAWLQLMQHPTSKPGPSQTKPWFWSRFLGRSIAREQPIPSPPSPPPKRYKLLVQMVPIDSDADFSLICPTPASATSRSCSAVSIVETESLLPDQPSCTAVPTSVDVDNGEEAEQASLHLMTCGSLGDQPSVAVISTAIKAYDSKKAYQSYQLQSYVDPLGQEGQEVDTMYSTAPVSSDRASVSAVDTKDDAPYTQHENRVGNIGNRALILQEVLKQVTAIFDSSGDGFDLDVEVLDVAPADKGQPFVTLDNQAHKKSLPEPAPRPEEELKSLRSTRSGLVRKMVDIFSRKS